MAKVNIEQFRLPQNQDIDVERFRIQAKPQTQTPKQKGFFERVGEDITERAGKVQTEIQDASQTPLEDVFQVAGQGAGLVGDIGSQALTSLFRGAKKVTPEFVKEPFREVGKDIAGSRIAQEIGTFVSQPFAEVLGDVEEKKKLFPRATRNIEAVTNLALLIPEAKALGTGFQATARGAKVAGEALKKSGKVAQDKARRGFLRELVRPEQTKAVKESQVARTTETGKGVFKRSIIAPTSQELAAEKELFSIPGVKKGSTAQRNFNVIQETNVDEAKRLMSDLKKNDFDYEVDELITRLKEARNLLERNPNIVGDSAKVADKLIAEVTQRVLNSTPKGSSLLQVRKEFDAWVKSQKGEGVFDPVKESAFTISNREVRQTINSFLNEKAGNVGVTASLNKQRKLFDALDNIKPKAAIEADTAFGRALQRAGKVLGTKNRIVQAVAAGAGITSLAALQLFAPSVAILGGTGFILFKGGKLILNPKVRIQVGRMLTQLEKKLPSIKEKSLKDQIEKDINFFRGLLVSEPIRLEQQR